MTKYNIRRGKRVGQKFTVPYMTLTSCSYSFGPPKVNPIDIKINIVNPDTGETIKVLAWK